MSTEELIQLINSNNLMKFYNCKEWRSLSKETMIKNNNECQTCKSKGKYKKAENVHHIKEVKEHPELALEPDNLMCLCIPCHNEVHDRYDNKKKDKPFVNEERW